MQLPPLTRGKILRRYKRFLCDIEFPGGEVVVAHCPNTGAMTSCWAPGAPVELSHSDNPRRKLAWTLERVDMGHGWVGVNTARVNAVIAEGIDNGAIGELAGYATLAREPKFEAEGHPGSRFDMLLTEGPGPDAYVEVKNATLLVDDVVRFPDAVTDRGKKHLELLEIAVKRGYRGVIVFAVNRPEGDWFEPAWEIDPAYGETLERVADNGVQAIVARLRHTATGIEVSGSNAWQPS